MLKLYVHEFILSLMAQTQADVAEVLDAQSLTVASVDVSTTTTTNANPASRIVGGDSTITTIPTEELGTR